MNPRLDAAVHVLDARACRLLLAFLASLTLWAAVLLGLERAMRPPLSDAPVPRPLAMQLVEIEPPPVEAEHAAALASRPQAVAPQPASLPALPALPSLPAEPADTALSPRSTQWQRPELARRVSPPAAAKPAAQPRQTAAMPTPSPALSSPAPSPTPPGNRGVAPDSPARPLAQPLPTLPDDLRERNLQAVALARFLIRADGSAEVTLLKPTPNPRLNQLLLETLRKWRFLPAMKDGKAAQSSQDIRVHFNVD